MTDENDIEDQLLQQAMRESLKEIEKEVARQEQEIVQANKPEQQHEVIDLDPEGGEGETQDTEEDEAVEEVPPAVDLQVDPTKYLVDSASSENTTRLRLRHLDGKNEVITILRDAPLAALYAIVRKHYLEHASGDQQDGTTVPPFKIVFMNADVENTLDKTLQSENIRNASLNSMFI